MTKLLTKLLALSLSIVSLGATANGGCPPGQYPQQGQGWQSCVPIPGYKAAAPSGAAEDGPAWRNSWQAVATDTDKGILGTATGKLSDTEAQSAALADCKAKGGNACELRMSHGNGCIAMTVGANQVWFNSASSKKSAERESMGMCSTNDSSCKVYYSECSLSERVR